MKEESTAQTSLVKNKWDKKKNGTNIYTNPKLCFLNYRGCRNTSKIPLAIIHLSFILAAFQVQSPQRFQWNLLTSWVRTMWLYSIKRIQNLILQHLSWKKKKKYIPHEIPIPAYTNICTAAGGANSSSSKKKENMESEGWYPQTFQTWVAFLQHKVFTHFYSWCMRTASLEMEQNNASWETVCQTTFRQYYFSVVSSFSGCFI